MISTAELLRQGRKAEIWAQILWFHRSQSQRLHGDPGTPPP